jgi:hypothetical protein
MRTLRGTAREAALATPADRDRVIDLIRAFSILGVVGGHVMMAIVHWDADVPELGNLLASSVWLQLLTWVLQVMPLFFIAGGAASYLSWQSASKKSMTYSEWLWRRMTRLLNPVFFYLSIMAPIGGLASRIVSPSMATPLLNLTTQLLWFLGVYLLITALTPLLSSLHHSRGPWQILGWLAIVVGADLARLVWDGPAAVGLVNFIAVWAVAAVCGIWYLTVTVSRKLLAGVVLGGITMNALLVFYGPYPVSLVGMPGESFSNMAPPSLVMAVQTLVMWAAVELLKPRLQSLGGRPRLWQGVVSVNLSAMTIYLWHLPTLIVTTVCAHLLNVSPPVSRVSGLLVADSDFWTRALPLWLVTWVLVYSLVRVLWSTEHITWPFFKIKHEVSSATWRTPVAIFGVIVTGIGMLLVSASGLSEFPTKVTEFAGLQWSSGVAVCWVVIGTIVVKTSTVLGQRVNRTQ